MSSRPKLFRDPVHNIIDFDLEDRVESILFELVNTQAFQRLRRVRQLGFANLVYHGAEHSRFSHSLGVFHVARKMVGAIDDFLDRERRLEVLCASLLHDIGHGPFSHAIESVTSIDHEEYTAQLIEDPATEVHRILSGVDGSLPRRVARYFRPRKEFPREWRVLKDIVSSQLDADRLDYILRDGQSTGVKIGVYDFERIHTMLEVYRGPETTGMRDTRLAVTYRAREAVEGYLLARFHMFKQVYLHRAVRAAEKMLESALRRASELRKNDYQFDYPVVEPLGELLAGDRLESQQFLDLDDTDIWTSLKRWRNADDEILASLAAGLLDRDLFKTVDLTEHDPVERARILDRASEYAEQMGYDPEYAVLSDRASDMPYRPYDPEHVESAAHIPIIEPNGDVVPIERNSDLVHLLGGDAYNILRICVPAPLRDRLVDSVLV
jgi:HD superfamily phosphohydrolase